MLAAGGGRGQEGVSLAENRRNKTLMIQPFQILDNPSLEARGKIIYICLGGLGLSLGLGSSPSLPMSGRGSPASPCGWKKKTKKNNRLISALCLGEYNRCPAAAGVAGVSAASVCGGGSPE